MHGRVGRRSRDVLATWRTRRVAADRREAGVGQRSSCFGSARLRARRRRGGRAAPHVATAPFNTRARAAVMLPTGRERCSSLAGLGHDRPVDTQTTGRVTTPRDVLASLRARRAAADRRKAGVGQRLMLCSRASRARGSRRLAAPHVLRRHHYTRSRGRRATDGPRALLVPWPTRPRTDQSTR